MRMALAALCLASSPAIAECLPNADVLATVEQFAPFGITSSSITDEAAIAAFASVTGFPGDISQIKSILFLFGRDDGTSIVFLMRSTETCHRMSAPTAAARALFTTIMGIRA